jgi:hypothetical protein
VPPLFTPTRGPKRRITCKSHSSVKTGRPAIKISEYMQFHLLYKLVKKNEGVRGVSSLKRQIIRIFWIKKSSTFFIKYCDEFHPSPLLISLTKDVCRSHAHSYIYVDRFFLFDSFVCYLFYAVLASLMFNVFFYDLY